MNNHYSNYCCFHKPFKNLFTLSFFIFSLCLIRSSLASDPVSVVQYPLINRPVLVLPGESFTVECKVKRSVKGWNATLSIPYKEVSLSVSVGGYASGKRTLTATVPIETPYEMYDLRIQASEGIDDVVRNCVRVLPAYKNDFTFVHLPDCHIPAVSWIGFYDDPNTVPELRQIVNELNIIHPEFVLQTGDLVDNGQDQSQYRLAQELLEECEIPIFMTGGNHDLWYDGHTYWYKYFGKTMDYSFLYGSIRFLGLEMYDIPTKTYTSEQMTWLSAALNTSIDAGEESRIIFTHYDESYQLTGDFVDQYLIDGIFYGHTHINGEQLLGLRQALKLNTSFTMNNNGEYRLVKVENGEIVEYPILKFRHLWVHVSPENDGTSWKMRAEIHNDNDVDLEGVLVKLHVRRNAAPFTVHGGNELQFIDYSTNKRVYYVTTDVTAHSVKTISVEGQTTGNQPPIFTTYSPHYDTTIYGGQTLTLGVQVEDPDGPSLTYTWRKNGNIVSGETGTVYEYRPSVDFQGEVKIKVTVSDGTFEESQSWRVYVEKGYEIPKLMTQTRGFFPSDQEVELQWIEPVSASGVFEYGLLPGRYTGSVPEEGSTNQVRFIPENEGMGLGIYYCRIRSGGLSSDEFPIVIESSQAPTMVNPVGNITTLTPVFQWEAVQGVPYYFLILTDQEVIVTEDPITGEYSLEGANPIWAVLIAENSVSYGSPDPSGTFTSFPAPLMPGGDYWWVVLNCYGNAPELTSTVQSGVSHFHIDLPLPDLEAPTLLSPDHGASLSGATLLFRWSVVPNAVGYHFYPFKVETEEEVEVVRPIWETVLTTTNTVLEYDAAHLLVKGNYQWKVAAVAGDGGEVPSNVRSFSYDAPWATLHLRTYDNRGTENTGDDQFLPRVTINYDALIGVDMGLPLSTDGEGERLNLIFAPGTYVFTANKEGFAPYQDTLTLAEGNTVTANFRLSPDPSTLTGTVQDTAGNPVASAQVQTQHSLHPEIVRAATSNQRGEFSVSLVPGPWLVSGAKAGYQESSQISVSVKSGEIKALDSAIVLQRNENRVSGIVVNPSGQPIYGAIVEISRSEDRLVMATDTDGRFTFSVYDGSWILGVVKSGFTSPPTRSISISGGQSLVVSPNLELMPSGSLVSGNVSDGLSVIGGSKVKAIPATGSVVSTTSDGYGQFSITLASGYYALSAEKEGFSPGDPVEISLGSGETVSGVTLLLRPNSGAILGLVTINGVTPLFDAKIDVNGENVLTDKSGWYEVEVPSGTYRVSASKTGYFSSNPLYVTVAPGQKAEGVDFILTPNASVINGRVLCGGGVVGALVKADNGTITETQTDDNGNYTLNVEAGTYTLNAAKSGFISDTLEIEVGQAQVLEGQNIYLTRNVAYVQGTVKEETSEEDLMGVKVEIKTQEISTTSKLDGSYRLEIEPSQTGYQIQTSKEGYETKVYSTGSLGAGETVQHNFLLKVFSTQLSGAISDEGGNRIGSAIVTAVSGSDTFSTLSASDGSYLLGLPSEGGTFAVSVMKNGYQFSDGTIHISFTPGEKQTRDLILQAHFARLKGQVYSMKDSTFIFQASVQLKNLDEVVGTVSSNDTGYYDFVNTSRDPFLWEGTYSLYVSKKGVKDTLITGILLRGGETTTLDIGLEKYTGYLNGLVTDGSHSLSDVTIVANHVKSEKRFTKITDSNGCFQLSSIPLGNYRLKISLSGYTWYASSVDTVITAPQSDISLILSENSGQIAGVIIDNETGEGIGYVSVVVRDGHGNEARIYSDADGSYEITQLPTLFPYDIYVSSTGYGSVSRENVSATEKDATNFQLQRIYGSLAGRVTLTENLSVSGALVRAQNGNVVCLDTTDTEGRYKINSLFTNLYYVSVDKAGYVSTPGSRMVDLSSGGDSTGIDFVLEEVAVASISISGPSSIMSGGSGAYTYAAKTNDGRQIGVHPTWSVNLPAAVDSLSSSGVLYPKDDFVGPLWVLVKDSYSGFNDSTQIQVQTNVSPDDEDWDFRDYRGASFHFPSSAVVQPISFGLKFPRIPEAKRVMRQYTLLGHLYAFQPAYILLKKPMTLVFPLPESAPEGCVLGKWNRSRLMWEVVEGLYSNGGLQIQSNQLAQWAVLAPARPLGIQSFEAKSNPFSPFIGPLKVSFVPTSDVSTDLFITVKIYNMAGDLVRELWVEKNKPKDTLVDDLYWDGKTDSGAMALNGRYLIYIEVRDGSGIEKLLKTVVLVK